MYFTRSIIAVISAILSLTTAPVQAGPVTSVKRAPQAGKIFSTAFGDYRLDESQPEGIRNFLMDQNFVPDYRILTPNDFKTVDPSAFVKPYTPPKGPATTTTTKSRRFILGAEDNRMHIDDKSFPYHSVGKLMWEDGMVCSGALVGPRHVLTAKHCLAPKGTIGTFHPGYNNGDNFGNATIIAAMTSEGQVKGSECETKFDWAVLALDKNLGDVLGYFGVKNPDKRLFGKPRLYHMGYPGDLDSGLRPLLFNGLMVYEKPSLLCDRFGPFFTNADTAGGQSGGPAWELDTNGDRWIWGTLSIAVSWGEGAGYAGFASGAEMIDTINEFRGALP